MFVFTDSLYLRKCVQATWGLLRYWNFTYGRMRKPHGKFHQSDIELLTLVRLKRLSAFHHDSRAWGLEPKTSHVNVYSSLVTRNKGFWRIFTDKGFTVNKYYTGVKICSNAFHPFRDSDKISLTHIKTSANVSIKY